MRACNIRGALSSLVLLACGSDPAIDEAQYAEALAHAQADADVRCCERLDLSLSGSGGWLLLPEPDPASGARFQPAAAAACLEETARRECGLAKDPRTAPVACADVYKRGRRRRGERCLAAWECAGADAPGIQASCSAALSAEGVWKEGVCFETRMAREGEDCSAVDLPDLVECVWPLICAPDRNVCVRRPGLGEACVTGSIWGDTCGQGTVCDRKQSKRCVLPKAVGESCTELEECENLACTNGMCREPLLAPAVCAR